MAIPSRVLAVEGLDATIDTLGQRRQVSLLLLADEGVRPGDYVLVQLGRFAYERMDEATALASLAAIEEVIAAGDAGLGWGGR